MKIGELKQRCGECQLIDYCGNPWSYCICTQEQFKDVSEETYEKIAETASIERYETCKNCPNDCENCVVEDEAVNYRCEQIADFVFAKLGGTTSE